MPDTQKREPTRLSGKSALSNGADGALDQKGTPTEVRGGPGFGSPIFDLAALFSAGAAGTAAGAAAASA